MVNNNYMSRKNMLKKHLFVCVMISSLSACSVSLSKAPEDYTGPDASRIRAKNYIPPLSMEIYEKEGSCYKKVSDKSLGPGFNIVGIKSTFNKRLPDMLPPSEQLKGADALEYRLKANQRLKITYTRETFRSQYNQEYTTYTYNFIPREGHDYDLYPTNTGIGIIDLNTQQPVPNSWGDDKECEFEKNWFTGGKSYK